MTVASLIMPSIIVSLGIGLQFRLLDNGVKAALTAMDATTTLEATARRLGLFTSAPGRPPDLDPAVRPAHHVRGVQPLRPGLRGGRARSRRHTLADFRHVVLPMIGPRVVGIGMFGFTLSWDEIARSSQAIG
jgi:putative spermidine/putrescine transport system permease protein